MTRTRRHNAVHVAAIALCVQQTRAWIPRPVINEFNSRKHAEFAHFIGHSAYDVLCSFAPRPSTEMVYGTPRGRKRLRANDFQPGMMCSATSDPRAKTAAGGRGGPENSKTRVEQDNTINDGRKRPLSKFQSVDFTTALIMSRELAQTVVPARVENAYQLDQYNVALGLRTLEGNVWLHISWHPQGARCHLGDAPPREREQKAYTFSQTLRSLVRGLAIVNVGLARPFERVVSLDLAARLGEPPSFRLYVEIMSSRSNVVLVSTEDTGAETIAACAYQVSPTKSIRPLSTGQAYELPPAVTARRPTVGEPLEDFTEGLARVPTVQLKKALVGVYQGTSPALVNIMASCVPGLSASTKVSDISQEQWRLLYTGPWRRWLELIGDGTTNGGSIRGDDAGGDGSDQGGEPLQRPLPWMAQDALSYYPTMLGGEGNDDQAEDEVSGDVVPAVKANFFDNLQQVMEAYYRRSQSDDEFDTLKRRCLARMGATLAKLRERAADFERQLAAAQEDKVAELNRRGDLLVTYGHLWQQGQKEVECVDFETGERVLVQIRSGKTPVEEAQEAFRKGKKFKRSAAVVQALLDQANAQILYAEGIELALEQLRGSENPSSFSNSRTRASREDLSVLRGISEELGLAGGDEGAPRFTAAFGIRQIQPGEALAGDDAPARAGTGKAGGGMGTKRGKKPQGKAKGGGRNKGGRAAGGGRGGGSSGAGKASRKDSSIIGLLELRRDSISPAVLVGRNNVQNDRITFSVARAHELWLHARGVAGAHVLLRLQPGQELEDEDLAFAADVAAFFSKGRQSKSVPVDYISPKAIKKLGGGGPGMVKYEGEKVTRGEPGRVEMVVAEAMRLRDEAAR